MRHTLIPLVALLAGCPPGLKPPDGSDPCAPGGTPTLEIGEGSGGFDAFAAPDPWPLVYGPQGGVHLEVGLRAVDLDLDDLVPGHLEAEIAGEVLATNDPWLDFRCTGDALESWGTQLVFEVDLADVADRLSGQAVVVRAEVTDRQGTSVQAEGTWTILDEGP